MTYNNSQLKRSQGRTDLNVIAGNSGTDNNSQTGFGGGGKSGNNSAELGVGAKSGNNSTGFGGGAKFGSNISLFGNKGKTEKHIDPVLQRLHRIRDAYKKPVATGSAMAMNKTTSLDAYKFSSIVYNVTAGGTAIRVQGLSQQDSDKECAKAKLYPVVNIDTLAPYLLCGFASLTERSNQQKEFVEKMSLKLKSMRKEIKKIRERYDSDFKRYIQIISENNQKISEKLMEVLKEKEVENSLDIPFSPEEQELFDKLRSLENEISKPNKFKSALNALNLKAIMIRESAPYYPEIKITDQVKEAEEVIKSNHEAISSLVDIISQTQKNTEALEKTYQEKIQTYIDSFNSFE